MPDFACNLCGVKIDDVYTHTAWHSIQGHDIRPQAKADVKVRADSIRKGMEALSLVPPRQ